LVESRVNSALVYAIVAATGNVIGAVAVTRRATTSLRLIEHSLPSAPGSCWPCVSRRSFPPRWCAAAGRALAAAGGVSGGTLRSTRDSHFHFGEETHAVNAVAGTSALVGLLLHTFFDGVAIASAFVVAPTLGVMVFVAIFLHKLPEGVTISSLMLAGGRSGTAAVRAAVLLGLATVAGVLLTDHVGFLLTHGLALSGGVTLYVAASNLVPEFQGKPGWKLPAAFFAGAVVFYATKLALDIPR
jgi:ZIP family zinc transporter/zinc and cadmium transporter